MHIFLTDETQIEFTRWLETFNKSLPSAVKRRKELSPFIYIRNNIDNSQHKGEVHEVFEALKIAIESSHSMYYFSVIIFILLQAVNTFPQRKYELNYVHSMCGCNSDTATLLLLPDGLDERHKFDYDIVIIGRGDVVALICAKESLRFGAKVAVVEYQDTALIG